MLLLIGAFFFLRWLHRCFLQEEAKEEEAVAAQGMVEQGVEEGMVEEETVEPRKSHVAQSTLGFASVSNHW